MAFTSSKQLFHLSFCSSDCQNRFVGQERETSSVKDRLTCLQRYNNGANSWDAAPLMVSKALRENVQVPSLPLQTFAILDVDSEDDLSSKALSDMKDLLMDLRRSLLESQWALPSNSAHLPPITAPVKEGSCSSGCLRLDRPSARERRIEARKKRKQKDGKSLAAMSSPTVRRQTLSSRIEKPSDSVSSVIELISGKGRKALLSKEEEILLSKKMKVGEKLRAAKRKYNTKKSTSAIKAISKKKLRRKDSLRLLIMPLKGSLILPEEGFGISRERTRQVRRLALRKLAASCRGMDLEHSLNV